MYCHVKQTDADSITNISVTAVIPSLCRPDDSGIAMPGTSFGNDSGKACSHHKNTMTLMSEFFECDDSRMSAANDENSDAFIENK